MPSCLRIHVLAALSIAVAAAWPAGASELTVYSGGAVKSALTEAAAIYEKQKGVTLALEFHPMGPLAKKLEEGARPDIVILTQEVLLEVAKKGWVAQETATEVGRVGIVPHSRNLRLHWIRCGWSSRLVHRGQCSGNVAATVLLYERL